MKTRIGILVIGLLLFSSCIIKSIQPFYLDSATALNENFIGNYKDNKKGTWQINSFEKKWAYENANIKPGEISIEDKNALERYKNGYFIEYTRKENKASFLGMSFKVNENWFIDFTPFEFESNINTLAAQHLVKTHSVAQFIENSDGTKELKWLSEKAIKALIDNKKLRLKHERTGFDEDLVLTASSKELYSFLVKFSVTEFENKWDNDVIYKLIPTNAKP